MTAIRSFQPMQLVREVQHSLRSWPLFAFYALATLGLAAFIGLMFGQMAWQLDFFLPGQFGQMTHGAAGSHRIHDFAYGLLVTTAVVGVLAQLRRPERNVAAMVMAQVPVAALVLAAFLSDDAVEVVLRRNPLYLVAVLAGVTALLHPTGRGFFRSFRVARLNWMMLGMVAMATVPLGSFASTNVTLQGTVLDDHAALGHYGFMAALSYTVIGVGVLASLRPDGWRLTAWVAGLLPALVGVWSVLFPDISSNFGRGWALAAIVWAAGFIAVAELSKDLYRPTPLDLWHALSRSAGPDRVLSRSEPE